MEEESVEQTHSKDAAPGELHLVQAFVNTRDVELGTDDLGSPDIVHDWLADHGLLRVDEPVTGDDRRLMLEMREALRVLLLANNDGRPAEGALERLNHMAGGARLVVQFEPDSGAQLAPEASGIQAAVGRLLSIVYRAMLDGSWQRLKACREDSCQWAFYDHSKNRSGCWCSMAVCGNRVKTRSYRQRSRSARA
jgi:predicted RNA-binding Zn ribbon-like protein